MTKRIHSLYNRKRSILMPYRRLIWHASLHSIDVVRWHA